MPTPSPPSMGSGRRASRLADESVSGCAVLVAKHCAPKSRARNWYFKEAERHRLECHEGMREAADAYGSSLKLANAQLRDGLIGADAFMEHTIALHEDFEHTQGFFAATYVTRIRAACAEALATTLSVLGSNPNGSPTP